MSTTVVIASNADKTKWKIKLVSVRRPNDLAMFAFALNSMVGIDECKISIRKSTAASDEAKVEIVNCILIVSIKAGYADNKRALYGIIWRVIDLSVRRLKGEFYGIRLRTNIPQLQTCA